MLCTAPITNSFLQFFELKLTSVGRHSMPNNCTYYYACVYVVYAAGRVCIPCWTHAHCRRSSSLASRHSPALPQLTQGPVVFTLLCDVNRYSWIFQLALPVSYSLATLHVQIGPNGALWMFFSYLLCFNIWYMQTGWKRRPVYDSAVPDSGTGQNPAIL